MTSLVLAHACGLPYDAAGQFEYYTYYLYRFISLLLPFIYLTTIPELRKQLRDKIFNGLARVHTNTTL